MGGSVKIGPVSTKTESPNNAFQSPSSPYLLPNLSLSWLYPLHLLSSPYSFLSSRGNYGRMDRRYLEWHIRIDLSRRLNATRLVQGGYLRRRTPVKVLGHLRGVTPLQSALLLTKVFRAQTRHTSLAVVPHAIIALILWIGGGCSPLIRSAIRKGLGGRGAVWKEKENFRNELDIT